MFNYTEHCNVEYISTPPDMRCGKWCIVATIYTGDTVIRSTLTECNNKAEADLIADRLQDAYEHVIFEEGITYD